jgi:hypothetical protein
VRFVHTVAGSHRLFILIVVYFNVVWLHHNLFIHATIHGHWIIFNLRLLRTLWHEHSNTHVWCVFWWIHKYIFVRYNGLLLCILRTLGSSIFKYKLENLNYSKALGDTLLSCTYSIHCIYSSDSQTAPLKKCEFQSKTVYKALVFRKAAQKLLLQLSLHRDWLYLFLADWEW